MASPVKVPEDKMDTQLTSMRLHMGEQEQAELLEDEILARSLSGLQQVPRPHPFYEQYP